MAHTEGGRHTLEIPLDASGIEGLKPDQPVKVIAVSRDLPIASEIVKLDAKGHAVARLALPERPGAIRVALGPADATDQELAGLQTINVNVAPRRWAGQATLKLSTIRSTRITGAGGFAGVALSPSTGSSAAPMGLRCRVRPSVHTTWTGSGGGRANS